MTPSPGLHLRAAAAMLRLVWSAGIAVDRALPEWAPPTPEFIDRALFFCWMTPRKIAPTPAEAMEDVVFDRFLARAVRLRAMATKRGEESS